MLLAVGPGVPSLQDYSSFVDWSSIQIIAQQGETLDEFKCRLRDQTSSYPIIAEDDLVAMDENDANGWPTCNLLVNPSFEGTYASGVPPNWNTVGGTGVTFASSVTALYGSESWSFTFANATSGVNRFGWQAVTLPLDEKGSPIRAQPFFFSSNLKVTTAFTNVNGWLQVDFQDVHGTFISSIVGSNIPLGSTTGWVRYSISGIAPVNAAKAICYPVVLNATNATNSGTILADGVQFEYATFGSFRLPGDISALAAGKYPTPYCDSAQAGCYVDREQSNLAYRGLRLFGGLVRQTHTEYTAGTERFLDLDAVDYGVLLEEAPATLIIQNQADNVAISSAFTYARNQGFLQGIDYTTFVANIATIDYHIYNWQTTKDVLVKISNQTVAAFWVDYNKYLHYQPALAVSAPFQLSDQPDFSSTFPFSAFYYDNDSTQTRTSPVIEGSTQLSAPQTQSFTGNGSTTSFTVNGGNQITQIDSCTVAGVAQVIGMASVNTYSQGYNALLDPQTAILTFQTAPANAAAINIVYRFPAPVLIRLHALAAEKTNRRKIHQYTKHQEVSSLQAAEARANADLAQYQKARPVAGLTVYVPRCPVGVPLYPGMAIKVSHTLSGFNQQLFQVQQVTTSVGPNGFYQRDLQLGFYRPNFIIQAVQAARAANWNDSNVGTNTPLADVLSLSDGWAWTDSVTATVTNTGTWGNPTSSTWSGSAVWA